MSADTGLIFALVKPSPPESEPMKDVLMDLLRQFVEGQDKDAYIARYGGILCRSDQKISAFLLVKFLQKLFCCSCESYAPGSRTLPRVSPRVTREHNF